MKKTFVITLILFLSSVVVYTQDDKFVVEFNDLINKLEKEIKTERAISAKYREKTSYLSKENEIKDIRLIEAIQKWNFANIQMAKKIAELKTMKRDYKILSQENDTLKIENKKLKLKLEDVTQQFEDFRLNQEEYKKTLAKNLEKRGKIKIYNSAIEKSYTDSQQGKTKTKVNKLKMKQFLFSFNSGLRSFIDTNEFEVDGPIFNIDIGYLVNQNETIFLGLGADYQYYKEYEKELFGVYFSTKLSLTKQELISDDFNLYSIINIGYSFSQENSELGSGFFTDIGLGIPFHLNKDIMFDIKLSWRRLDTQLKINDIVDDTILNSADLKLGFILLL